MKNNIKKLISIFVCVVLCVSLSTSAFAELSVVTRAKAFIAATLLATNLVIEPVGAAWDNAFADSVDPFHQIQSISHSTWQDYLDQSVIQVRPNSILIDGIEYSDILIGPEATQSLRASGLDFITVYNILNNQDEAISYASGKGYLNGMPVYEVNGNLTTPLYGPLSTSTGSYSTGDITVRSGVNSGPYRWIDTTINGSTSISGNISYQALARNPIYIRYHNSGGIWRSSAGVESSFSSVNTLYNSGIDSKGTYISSPFSFDYTSGVIDAPLADDDWLSIRVPTQYNDPVSGNTYNIQNIVNNYPSLPSGHTINVDPSLNPDFQTDIDLGNDLGDLVNTILNLLDFLKDLDGFKIEINKNVEPQPEPEPAPVPDPGVIPDPGDDPGSPSEDLPVADIEFSWLDNLLRWIQSTIDSFRVAVQNQLLNIQDSINAIKSAFDNAIQNILEFLQDILDAIQNIDQILQDLFDNILDAIEQGPVKLWRSALNVLKTVFAPILATLKTFVGLWHYVVEWVGVILNPFLWFFNLMSGTSYNMVLPIYAGLAGFIVIAIYKRFGR